MSNNFTSTPRFTIDKNKEELQNHYTTQPVPDF